jgi:hypothetical protein
METPAMFSPRRRLDDAPIYMLRLRRSIMTGNELKRFSFAIDFIEPDPQVDSPDMRARVLGEHETAIRATAARITTLLTSDTQIATLLTTHGIQLRTELTH